MAIATYAGLIERYTVGDFALSSLGGGSTTVFTNFHYFICGITRGGVNLLTPMGSVSVTIGSKLRFTVNPTVRPNGLQPFGFALGASPTSDETQAKILAIAWVIAEDQENNNSLPLSIELTTDQDFLLDGSVTAFSNLPTNPVNGAIRYVDSDAAYYQWDGDGWYEDTPSWVQVYGNELYLPNTTTLRNGLKWKGGCDVPIPTIPADPLPGFYGVISPPWSGDGDTSAAIKLWLLNGLTEGIGTVLPIDSQINLIAFINDDTELGSSTLSGNIDLLVTGVVRRLDGILSVINTSATWNSGTPFYLLESQLERGYALEVEYTCSATVGDGDRVTAYLRDNGVFGVLTQSVFLGDAVFANNNKALIVPDTLGVKRLSGSGLILTEGQEVGYYFNTSSELGLTQGITADTADQQIAISGIQNGAIRAYQPLETLLATDKVRAVISTESGTATASAWTTPVAVGANGRIEVTINLPDSIRSDYTDVLIAGNSDAVRNVPRMRIFVRLSGTITELASVVVETDSDQVIVIDDLAGGSVVGSLPSNGDADFNLWPYGTIVPVVTGVGNLVAGNYEVAIGWDYPSPNLAPTKVSHDINDGCIPTLSLNFADAINLAEIFSEIQLEGVIQPQRQSLDFNTRLTTIVDDPSNNRIRISFPGVPRVTVQTTDPTATDDSSQGYEVGDFVINTTPDPSKIFWTDDVSVGAATWNEFGSGSGSGAGITAIADLATLKALSSASNDDTFLLKTNATSGLNNNIYRYDDSSAAADDDNTVILPDTLPGRFLKVGTLKSTEIVEESDKFFVTAAEQAAITQNTSDIADLNNEQVTIEGGLATGDGTNQVTKSPGIDGQFLSLDTGVITWVDAPSAASTFTTLGYVQPAVNGTVLITVGSTDNFVAGLSRVVIETGGRYAVVSVDTGITMTVEYLGGGAAPTTSIPTNRKVGPSGTDGEDGSSPVTTTASNFTVPAVGATVVVDVVDSGGFNLGVNVNIESFGNCLVTAIATSPDTITVENLGGGNTAPGATISSGSRVVVTGPPGQDGAVTSTSSLIFTSAIAPPSTAASEWKKFINSSNSNRPGLRPPNDGTVLDYAFLSDILPTLLTGFVASSASDLEATDTILEAFQKIQGYISSLSQSYIPINLGIPEDKTYILFTYPTGEVESLTIQLIEDLKTSVGTCTLSIQIDGVPVTGLDAIAVTSTGQNLTATANNSVTATGVLTMVVSSNSAAGDLTGTIRLKREP